MTLGNAREGLGAPQSFFVGEVGGPVRAAERAAAADATAAAKKLRMQSESVESTEAFL